MHDSLNALLNNFLNWTFRSTIINDAVFQLALEKTSFQAVYLFRTIRNVFILLYKISLRLTTAINIVFYRQYWFRCFFDIFFPCFTFKQNQKAKHILNQYYWCRSIHSFPNGKMDHKSTLCTKKNYWNFNQFICNDSQQKCLILSLRRRIFQSK